MASGELAKRQTQMTPDKDKQTVKLIQYVKTRWNSVFKMFQRLVELRWPVTAVLSDKSVKKQADAKTLDMREEYWALMSDLLPLLQPLQVMTSLYCTGDQPSASAVYPTLWSFVKVDLQEKDGAVATFKKNMTDSLRNRFAMTSLSTANHPFVVATVLDPAMKAMADFPDNIRAAAYDNVRALVSNVEGTVGNGNEVESDATSQSRRRNVRNRTRERQR